MDIMLETMPSMDIRVGGLLCAGNGSRLRDSLVEIGELYITEDGYFFTDNDNPFEKSLVDIVPAHPRVANHDGVKALDFSVKDLIKIPTLREIRFLTNPNSNIPEAYGEAIDRNEFLMQLGLPALQGDGVSRFVTCTYIEQQPKSISGKYGTAYAMSLVANGEPMIITETDSIFLSADGESEPAKMLSAMQRRDMNPKRATAGLIIAPLAEDVDRGNGLGLALMKRHKGARYFTKVFESAEHGNIDEALAGGLEEGRNTTRIVADSRMLELNEDTVDEPPSQANNGELQATDTYNKRAEEGAVYAHTLAEGVDWYDIGKYPGLRVVRGIMADVLRSGEWRGYVIRTRPANLN